MRVVIDHGQQTAMISIASVTWLRIEVPENWRTTTSFPMGLKRQILSPKSHQLECLTDVVPVAMVFLFLFNYLFYGCDNYNICLRCSDVDGSKWFDLWWQVSPNIYLEGNIRSNVVYHVTPSSAGLFKSIPRGLRAQCCVPHGSGAFCLFGPCPLQYLRITPRHESLPIYCTWCNIFRITTYALASFQGYRRWYCNLGTEIFCIVALFQVSCCWDSF